LSFAVKETNIAKLTKRAVLSNIASLYDPLGLASAVTIKARIAFQDIWQAKDYDWDDPLPDEMVQRWQLLFKEIQELRTLWSRPLWPIQFEVWKKQVHQGVGCPVHMCNRASHPLGNS